MLTITPFTLYILQQYTLYRYPYLQYCISTWGNASHLALQPSMTLQKCCIRILTGGGYRDTLSHYFGIQNVLKINIYRLELA